ncbi:unnamed protein product [Sphagnum troendelagicum]
MAAQYDKHFCWSGSLIQAASLCPLYTLESTSQLKGQSKNRLQYIHCFEQLREIAACGEGQDRITHVLYLTGNTSRGKGCITDKLEELKQQSFIHSRSELEHKVVLQYCKVKSFERWKIEHSIWWLKEQKRASDDNPQWLADPTEQLIQLKEDLEYVQHISWSDGLGSVAETGSEDEAVDMSQDSFCMHAPPVML